MRLLHVCVMVASFLVCMDGKAAKGFLDYSALLKDLADESNSSYSEVVAKVKEDIKPVFESLSNAVKDLNGTVDDGLSKVDYSLINKDLSDIKSAIDTSQSKIEALKQEAPDLFFKDKLNDLSNHLSTIKLGVSDNVLDGASRLKDNVDTLKELTSDKVLKDNSIAVENKLHQFAQEMSDKFIQTTYDKGSVMEQLVTTSRSLHGEVGKEVQQQVESIIKASDAAHAYIRDALSDGKMTADELLQSKSNVFALGQTLEKANAFLESIKAKAEPAAQSKLNAMIDLMTYEKSEIDKIIAAHGLPEKIKNITIEGAMHVHGPSGEGVDKVVSLGISKAYTEIKSALTGLTGKTGDIVTEEAQKALNSSVELGNEWKKAMSDGVVSAKEKAAVQVKENSLLGVAKEAHTTIDGLKEGADAALKTKLSIMDQKLSTLTQEAADKTASSAGSLLDKASLMAVCIAGGAGLIATLLGAGTAIGFFAKKAKSGRNFAKSAFERGFQAGQAASTFQSPTAENKNLIRPTSLSSRVALAAPSV